MPGIVAPNPSELLMNGRFKEIISYAKKQYDYIIVDTAPVKMVTDTVLLSETCRFIFIYCKSQLFRQTIARDTSKIIQ